MWKWDEVSSLFELLDWYAQLTRISCKHGQKKMNDKFIELILAYRLMNAAPVEGLHGPLSSAGVIELDETVVVSFAVEFLWGRGTFSNQLLHGRLV